MSVIEEQETIVAFGPPAELDDCYSGVCDADLIPHKAELEPGASELEAIAQDPSGVGVYVRRLAHRLDLGKATYSEDVLRGALSFIEKAQAAKPTTEVVTCVARADPRRDIIVAAWREYEQDSFLQGLTSRQAFINDQPRENGLYRLTASEKLEYG